jgi:hypothetical protein
MQSKSRCKSVCLLESLSCLPLVFNSGKQFQKIREFLVSLVILHYILFSIREVAEQTEGGGPRRSKRGRAAGQQDSTPAEPPSAPTSPNPKKSRKQNKDDEVAVEDPPARKKQTARRGRNKSARA